MSVPIPPKVAACDIGIRMRFGLAPLRRHTSMTTGMKTATAAVLLINAESAPMVIMITIVSLSSELPIGVTRRRAMCVRAPVLSTASFSVFPTDYGHLPTQADRELPRP
jgi:hypothetical protein